MDRYVNMSSNLLKVATDTMNRYPQQTLGTIVCVTIVFLLGLGRRKPSTTYLPGPPSPSRIFGVSGEVFRLMNPSSLYLAWSKAYGPIYKIPLAFGDHAVVIADPKAVATFFSRDTSIYHQSHFVRDFFRHNFGNTVLVSDGEDHKRQRRALSSGFSISAIRELTPLFLQSAHQVSDAWKEIIDSKADSSAVIDVQYWINAITLDSIGKGGFSHDFEATRGKLSAVQQRFEAFSDAKLSAISSIIFLLSTIFPSLRHLPTDRARLITELSESIKAVAFELLEKARLEKQSSEDRGVDKSILGALIKSETASANIHMDLDEITAQISLFMLAGYDTTATSISWCLAELARNPDVQQKLRDELETLSGDDPSYEQLGAELPYLDAVICETLRLHPPVPEVNRQAKVDDVLPLTKPIANVKGEMLDSLPIPAGTSIRIPLGAINLDEEFWGETSRVFDPSRWMDDGSRKKTEQISGFRHLLTFGDGPRACIGRLFALTEFKATLSVLIRDYSLELPKGPDTTIALHRALTPRPKVEGEDGPFLPMVVRKLRK